uniref:Three-finger toxin n=1 Tax=Calliophis bivirgatus TaxID=8633 RepID=A0A898IPI9_CALBG|nr:three-finger toxin [Calliophis bivirgatus]
MKTLLLTLVVVTIVCLDLGDTLICYKTKSPEVFVTCKGREKYCYKESYMVFPLVYSYHRGCTEYCSNPNSSQCCATDKCNK